MRKNKFYFIHCQWGIYTYLKVNDIVYHIYINNDGSIQFIDPSSTPINVIIMYTTSIYEINIENCFIISANEIKINYDGRLIIKQELLKQLNRIINLMIFL